VQDFKVKPGKFNVVRITQISNLIEVEEYFEGKYCLLLQASMLVSAYKICSVTSQIP
jgi:hypothetical protein